MSYTVARLHKELGKLIEQGHGRKPVQINKQSFHHILEDDGAVIMDIEAIEGPKWIPLIDADGGTKWNRDGTESGYRVVVLSGDRSQQEGKSHG